MTKRPKNKPLGGGGGWWGGGGGGGTVGGAWGELVMNAERKEGSGEERSIVSRGKRREEGREAK
jgi:hypothetical protein